MRLQTVEHRRPLFQVFLFFFLRHFVFQLTCFVLVRETFLTYCLVGALSSGRNAFHGGATNIYSSVQLLDRPSAQGFMPSSTRYFVLGFYRVFLVACGVNINIMSPTFVRYSQTHTLAPPYVGTKRPEISLLMEFWWKMCPFSNSQHLAS